MKKKLGLILVALLGAHSPLMAHGDDVVRAVAIIQLVNYGLVSASYLGASSTGTTREASRAPEQDSVSDVIADMARASGVAEPKSSSEKPSKESSTSSTQAQ